MKTTIGLFSPRAWGAILRTLVLAAISLCILGVGPKRAAAQSAQWSSWFSKIPEAKTGQWDNAVRVKHAIEPQAALKDNQSKFC